MQDRRPSLGQLGLELLQQALRLLAEDRAFLPLYTPYELYGVRRDLQEQLVRDGWRVRVYVPFGTQWYPYLMRRLAERPANIAFILGNVLRETFA